MATSAEPLIFQHNPLPDAKTHIRLLKVVSVGDSRPNPVHCELATFPIAEAPPYRAISYTWGDPTSLTSILLNGQPMVVRVNCEYALRQASQHDGDETGDRFLWIDSICINQHDNEKGAQVAIMGDIFKTASRVLACVGAHKDDSEFLYQFLRGKRARIQKFIDSGPPCYEDGSFVESSWRFRMEAFVWRWRHSRSFLRRLSEAVAKFLARPYFRRVWIYQELFLGRHINIYCGDEIVPISWAMVTSSIIECWLLFQNIDNVLSMPPDMMDKVLPPIRKAVPLLVAGAKEQSHKSLIKVTADIATLSCEDPRDKVYGILSIIKPMQGYEFQPDYTKDTLDLAVEVMHRAISELATSGDGHRFWGLTEFTRKLGLNLGLNDESTQKLNRAMDLRRSAMNSHDTEPNLLLAPRIDANGAECLRLWGFQIRYNKNRWTLLDQGEGSREHNAPFVLPTMRKYLQGDSLSDIGADIHLPPKTQDRDWLLTPAFFNLRRRGTYDFKGAVAFLARQYDSEKFEVIGMILMSRWLSKWVKPLERSASEFQFYCDPEDLLALFACYDWNSMLWRGEPMDSKSSDAFFDWNFCGHRFSSYATRTET